LTWRQLCTGLPKQDVMLLDRPPHVMKHVGKRLPKVHGLGTPVLAAHDATGLGQDRSWIMRLMTITPTMTSTSVNSPKPRATPAAPSST
jgi:hypothetical protein